MLSFNQMIPFFSQMFTTRFERILVRQENEELRGQGKKKDQTALQNSKIEPTIFF